MTRHLPVRIAPSLLACDFARLGQEAAVMEAAGADRIHWDVMDGNFVPNLTIGPDIIASARPHTALPFEAHLMVTEPGAMLARWVEAGCERITVHAEACLHLHRTLAAIAELGARAGVAINPATPPSAVEHILDLVDLVLVMTVNPGFGGQRYIAGMESKVTAVAAMVRATGRPIEVEVDGGISADTIAAARAAGAGTFVSGSALYRHPQGIAAAIAVGSSC
ncbi:MAG: ribulose-phosphate 3-epimerase, partial [Acidimicrobiales bacterium]